MKELLYDTATSRPKVEVSSTDGQFKVSESSTSSASVSKPSASSRLLSFLEETQKSSEPFQGKLLAALTTGGDSDRAIDERIDKLESKIDAQFAALFRMLQGKNAAGKDAAGGARIGGGGRGVAADGDDDDDDGHDDGDGQ
jgi:hypothetical protein